MSTTDWEPLNDAGDIAEAEAQESDYLQRFTRSNDYELIGCAHCNLRMLQLHLDNHVREMYVGFFYRLVFQ